MATIVPPPSKRQKREAAERASKQEQPKMIPKGSVRIRFIDRTTNTPNGPSVSVPLSQATVKNLEILLNSLNGVTEATNRIPYQFFYRHNTTANQGSEKALSDNADIHTDIIDSGMQSAERKVDLEYAPQAVFRVRAVCRCTSTISGHGAAILAAQFSPSKSSRMVTGSGDNTARVWDCDTGTPIRKLQGHSSWVLCVSYSPDGTIIATGSNDKTVRIWEAETGKALGGPLKGHTGFVRSLAWEPYHLQQAGRPRLASSSKDSTIRIWDVVTKRADIVLSGHKAGVSCVRWGGTGLIYSSSQDKTIKVWNASDGTLVRTITAHAHWVNHLALSTDFVLRTGYYDHTGVKPPTEEERIATAKSRFENAATVNDRISEKLISASDDNLVCLWDPQGEMPGRPIARLNGHQKQVNYVTFSPNGLYIASASFDNSVKLWNATDGTFIRTFRGHVASVYECAFSADSRLLVSCSKDTTLKCWDVSTGKIATDMPGHKDEIYAVDWSPDGKCVASGGKDRAVKLWRN